MSTWLGSWLGGGKSSSTMENLKSPKKASAAAVNPHTSPGRAGERGENASSSRVSLAFRGMTELHSSFAAEYGGRVRELDLTENRVGPDLTILADFPRLESLILDNNHLTDQVKFPRHARLSTLWMNNNKLENLIVVTNKLVGAFPSLRILSMLNNPACPNFFNGGTPSQYRDYRLYLISRISGLRLLDSDPVTEEERKEAKEKYGDKAARYGVYLNGPNPELVTQSNDVKSAREQEQQAAAASPAPAAVRAKTASSTKKSRRNKQIPSKTSAPPPALAGVVPSLDELESVPAPPPPRPSIPADVAQEELPSLGSSSENDFSDSDYDDVF